MFYLRLQLRNSEGSLIIPKGSIEVNTSSTSVVIACLLIKIMSHFQNDLLCVK